MGCSTPGFPVHHQLLQLTQTHVHQVSDATQPSHPLSPPSLPAFNLSQHQGLFQWVSSSHHVAKVLELQLQHQSFQWTLRTDLNHFQFTLIHEHNIPGSYTILFLTASVFTSITNHIHIWAFFFLWLCLFILSGVISPLISSNTWTVNFQMFKLDLEKAEDPEIKLPTSVRSLKKQESSRKTSTSALLTMPKPLTV